MEKVYKGYNAQKMSLGVDVDMLKVADTFDSPRDVQELPFTKENFNELKERYIKLLIDYRDEQDKFHRTDKRYRTCIDAYMDTIQDLDDSREYTKRLNRTIDEKERLIYKYIDMLNNNGLPDNDSLPDTKD